MKYAIALSFSKTTGTSTEQKIDLFEEIANSPEEALGKAINNNWSAGWHLTHYAAKILCSEKNEQSEVK